MEKIVARIDQDARMDQLILDLGRKHFGYDASPKYYQVRDVLRSGSPGNNGTAAAAGGVYPTTSVSAVCGGGVYPSLSAGLEGALELRAGGGLEGKHMMSETCQ